MLICALKEEEEEEDVFASAIDPACQGLVHCDMVQGDLADLDRVGQGDDHLSRASSKGPTLSRKKLWLALVRERESERERQREKVKSNGMSPLVIGK